MTTAVIRHPQLLHGKAYLELIRVCTDDWSICTLGAIRAARRRQSLPNARVPPIITANTDAVNA
jgi:hypothetical protein